LPSFLSLTTVNKRRPRHLPASSFRMMLARWKSTVRGLISSIVFHDHSELRRKPGESTTIKFR
jgi:hypothetical protein